MGKYQGYDKYKDSGVEWLGDIPEHWEVKRLKNIASCNDESLAENTAPDYEIEYVDISSVDLVSGIKNYENMSFDKAPSRARRKVQDGDTIISTVRTYLKSIATIKQPPNNLIVSTGFAVIRPKININPNYIGYLLQSEGFIGEIVSSSLGVSYPAINSSVLISLPVVEPPLEEQEKIAQFLDYKTKQIDELIAKKETLIEKLDEKRTSLISHAVTKGIDVNVPMKDSGIEWLGEIPKHWRRVMVKRVAKADYKSFTDGDWIESPYITELGVRLLQTGNVGIGYYREQGFRFISEETFKELKCTEILPNDVLVCRLDGPVGRACLVPNLGVRMITSVDNSILKVSENFDSRFIVYLMSSNLWLDWIKSLCRVGGGFRFRISRTILGEQIITEPPLHEQQKIANYLDQKTAEIEEQKTKIQQAIDVLKEYRTALITNAVTGKIDVRKIPIPN